MDEIELKELLGISTYIDRMVLQINEILKDESLKHDVFTVLYCNQALLALECGDLESFGKCCACAGIFS